MKKMSKVLLLVLCAALLVAASALILEPDLVSRLFLGDQVARV